MAPPPAQSETGLELVFPAGAAGATDDAEIRSQRQDDAEAIITGQAVKAIDCGLPGAIAVTHVTCGDFTSQVIVAGSPGAFMVTAERAEASPPPSGENGCWRSGNGKTRPAHPLAQV